MKYKLLKYFLPAEHGSERCCRASLSAAGLPASHRPFPGGCPRLDTWKFTQKRGEIQLLPHPWYCLPARRLCWWQVLSHPAQRSCGIAWQDSIKGQHRHPQREDKIRCCSTGCNRAAGLCPGTAAEDLSTEHRVQDASTKRDGGLETESSSGDEQMDWHVWMYRKNWWGPCLLSAHPMWTSIPSTWAWISKQAENCYPGYTFVSNRNRRWPCLSE